MNNGNDSLFEEENNQYINNTGGLFKYIISAIINIVIISCFISYSLKYNISKNMISNKNKNVKPNINPKLRNLDSYKNIPKIDKQIIIHSKNKLMEEDMRKYLSFLLDKLDTHLKPISDILSGKPFIITKEAFFYEKQKQIFVSRLIRNTYSGTWEYFPYIPHKDDEGGMEKNQKNISVSKLHYINSSKSDFKIGNYRNGSVNFNFKLALEMSTNQEALALTMRIKEGDFIDNWIQHLSYIKINNLNRTIDNKSKLYIAKGVFSTSMIKGEVFSNPNNNKKKILCSTFVEIEFPLTQVTLQTNLNNKTTFYQNISTINPTNFTMILSSMCGFRIKIKAHIYDRLKELKNTKIIVYYYSYFCVFASFLYLIGTFSLTFSLNENENAISAISLECFCQNIAWHSYCGITNINLGLFHPQYFANFLIIALLPLINFVIMDIRFLYFYWKIKKRLINDREYLKLRCKFFGVFYGLLLVSFFSISTFYTNKIYITILSLALWSPQIIHNIINNNKYIYPTFYIFANTLDRIIYPFYFRGFKNNFFHLKRDIILLTILSIYILITIIIMYLQAFLGPRFMLSSKYQKKNFEFHKTKEELLEERPDCIKEECVICLSPLIEEENAIENCNNKNVQINVIINNNEEESESSSDSPTEMKTGNNNKNSINSFDLMKYSFKKPNINNSKNNVHNNDNEINLSENNNNSLAIEVKDKNSNNINNSNKYFLIKSIGNIFKIIFYENVFKFYKIRLNFRDKKYMIIACGHIFHSTCLEKWFDRKKECPNCRASMEEYL